MDAAWVEAETEAWGVGVGGRALSSQLIAGQGRVGGRTGGGRSVCLHAPGPSATPQHVPNMGPWDLHFNKLPGGL